MGYSATVGSYKKVLTEQQNIVDVFYCAMLGNADVSIFKKYFDFSNFEYYDTSFQVSAIGVNGTITFYKNGTDFLNQTFTGGYVQHYFSGTIPAGLRNYGLLNVCLKTDNAMGVASAMYIKFIKRDVV